MNALTAALKEELNVEMISFIGGLQIPESVVVSWGIMAFSSSAPFSSPGTSG